MKELVKLGIDLYKGSLGQYSKEQANEAFRQALIEMNGGKAKIDPKDFRRNKIEIFEIIEETLDQLINEVIDTQFNDFIDVRNLNWGDTVEFEVPNRDLFDVATVVNGNGSLRRQRLGDGQKIPVSVQPRAVKVYEEMHRFLSGRIDWAEMVNRVAKSFEVKLADEIYGAIYNSYDNLVTPYKVSGTFSETDLTTLIAHVEAATGQQAEIFGTKTALGKITSAKESDKMKDALNSFGYYGTFKGTGMREIKQFHKINTDTFAINDSFLMILPVGDIKIAKLVIEGDSIIDEFSNNQGDMSKEFMFIKNYGLTVLSSAKYGIYRLS